ncbi:MAG: hypothetical protein EBR82_66155 [Caulobacteraceae bacterium]|nr:hypothetical protein [Caulobacteraceae bacterium]
MTNDEARDPAASLGSGFFGWIGIPRVVRRMFRHCVATVAKSGHTVTVECAGLDESEALFRWLEDMPNAITLADESLSRRKASEKDIDRVLSLPLLEQLRDRGDAMKIVPTFAVLVMGEAAKEIERLRGSVQG